MRNTTIAFAGGTITLRIQNPTLVTDPVPVLYVTGFGGTKESTVLPVKALLATGRTVVTYSLSPETRALPNAGQMPDMLHTKAVALLAAVDRLGVAEVDTVGHSEGCAVILLAAQQRPGLFRRVVLVAPPGLKAPESVYIPYRLVRQGLQTVHEFSGSSPTAELRRRNVAEAAAWARQRGRLRTLRERLQLARVDLRKEYGVLAGRLGKRLRTVAFEGDQLIPLEDLVHFLGERQFTVMPGGHDRYWTDTAAARVVAEVLANL